MSNKPSVASPESDTAPVQTDPTLLVRRIVVWVVSVILAILGTIFLLQIGVPAIWPNNGRIPLDSTVPISFVNLPLLPLVALPLTFLFLIWVDYFFRTRIVND